MEDPQGSALAMFLLYFVGPLILGGLIGATQLKATRFRGAVIGGAVGMLVGYAAFQIIVINNLEMPPAAEQQPETSAQLPISE